jgi:hypothetical protein
MKILFICKKRLSEYGISIGLNNSSAFISNYLNKKGIESKSISVTDANSIDKEVFEYKPTHVVIQALWVPAYKFKELLLIKRYKNIKWIVSIHSKIPFLANEGIAIKWLNEYKDLQKDFSNLIISANSKETVDCIRKALKINCIYLPNIYMPLYYFNKFKNKSNIINIGCFGAVRPLKNQLIQAMAAIAYGDKYKKIIHFHMNGKRTEQKGDIVLKNIQELFKNTKHSLIEHEWKNHKEFLNLVNTMDIGLQVSLTETFNIVAADFVHCFKPIVISPEISWASFISKANPHDINDIVEKIHKNLKCNLSVHLNYFKLYLSNKKSGKKWLSYLKSKN